MITVNGKERVFEGQLSLQAFLTQLSFDLKNIAIALNNEIIPRSEWNQTLIKDGDCIEIVQARSEEHTSELQSRRDLVCRLLLEKKKKKKKNNQKKTKKKNKKRKKKQK